MLISITEKITIINGPKNLNNDRNHRSFFSLIYLDLVEIQLSDLIENNNGANVRYFFVSCKSIGKKKVYYESNLKI